LGCNSGGRAVSTDAASSTEATDAPWLPDAPVPIEASVDARSEGSPDAHVYDCPGDAPSGCKYCGPYPDAAPIEIFSDHPECIWGDYCFFHPDTPDCVRQCSTEACWSCDDKGWQLVESYDNNFCLWLARPDAG
jgi:hypothetical protein